MNSRILAIQEHGKTAKGKKEILKHLSGSKLTFKQAIYARCYDCMGYFADGKIDCKMPACPLHPFMVYNQNRVKRNTETISNAQMEKMRAAT